MAILPSSNRSAERQLALEAKVSHLKRELDDHQGKHKWAMKQVEYERDCAEKTLAGVITERDRLAQRVADLTDKVKSLIGAFDDYSPVADDNCPGDTYNTCGGCSHEFGFHLSKALDEMRKTLATDLPSVEEARAMRAFAEHSVTCGGWEGDDPCQTCWRLENEYDAARQAHGEGDDNSACPYE